MSNIIRIDKNNQVNGPGLRCVVWIAGCINHCDECHNPESWDYNYGHAFTFEDFREISEQLDRDEVSGVTLTGGDPFAPQNRHFTRELAKDIKAHYPNKTIWCYSGYLFEELVAEGDLDDIDVLIDGLYVKALNPGRGQLKWRGSSNQRIINVAASKQANTIISYETKL